MNFEESFFNERPQKLAVLLCLHHFQSETLSESFAGRFRERLQMVSKQNGFRTLCWAFAGLKLANR